MTQNNDEAFESKHIKLKFREAFGEWWCSGKTGLEPRQMEFAESIWQKIEIELTSITKSPISQNEQQEAVSEWLEIEISAIDTRYRGSPSYDHDAYWFKNEVLEFISKNRTIIDNFNTPPKQIPEGWITNALVESLNCDYQSTLDSEQVKIFNMGVATLYEIIKESKSKSLTSETNTEVGE